MSLTVIRFYLPHILESAGIKEAISALLGNGVGGAVNFIATLFVLFYVSVSLCRVRSAKYSLHPRRSINGIDVEF